MFVIVVISLLVFQNERMASRLKPPLDEPYLTDIEVSRVREIYRVQTTLGNQVWPGFGDLHIPVLLYNDRYYFIFTEGKPSLLWKPVSRNNDQEITYYRNLVKNPQAFAVKIGDQWAGSFGTLKKANKSYYLGIRSQLPPVLKNLFPYQLATLSDDFYVAAIIHEMFHAFQAEQFPGKFRKAGYVYNVINKYPYHDESIIQLWNKEGEMLARALESSDKKEIVACLSQFIKIREKRRQKLTPELIELEKRIEWLEGLAKYAEMKAYELAAGQGRGTGMINYKKGLPYWQQEIGRLKKLGEVSMGDDFRFYLSGMAQARLLDKLKLDWKKEVMKNDVFLEDIIINYLSKLN